MSFGYNPYGGGRGRGTRPRRGVGGAPFSGVLASGGPQVSLSPNQVNPQTNTWREQHVGDVYQQYNQPNASYSANQYSHNENIKQGEFPGRWPADGVDASWQSWQGDLAGNQQQNAAKNEATPLLRCSLCNIDFSDRKV